MTQFRPDPIAHMTGALRDTALPREITPPGGGGKFTTGGQILPWAGNTMICHIDPLSDAHAALIDIQHALKAGPSAGSFAFLPPSSLHMTVFQGISGPGSEEGNWPAGVPAGTDRDTVSSILLSRLDGIDLPATRRIRALDIFAGHSMTVDGVGADEDGLRDTRRRLKAATGMSQAGFDTYTFHITLAYQLRWLSETEAQGIEALTASIFAEHGPRLQAIDLGRVEFCNFEDMFHFEPLRHL